MPDKAAGAALVVTLTGLLCACGGGGGGGGVETPAPTPTLPIAIAIATDADLAARPRRLQAQPLSDQAVLLSWTDASSDETGFSVERRPAGSGAAWTAAGTAPANAQLLRDATGLTGGAAFEYRVTALRPGTAAAPTAAVTATLPTAASPTVFFVDAVNGLNSNPGTEARPWATLQKAHDELGPGQTVVVRAGTYKSTNYTILAISRSGTAGAPITYRAYPGERPLLRSTLGKNYHGIEIRSASYIVIDGFDIQGHLSEVTTAMAQKELDDFKAGITPGAVASSSGISVESRDPAKPIAHHIVIRNNRVFEHPLGGINAMGADWVTIANNRISDIGRYSSYGGSAISVLSPRDSDTNTSDYKFVIDGNQVSEAVNDYPCSCAGFKQPTDGNGIILDSYGSYQGRSLVVNNLSFNNGGRGIHVFKAGNADIVFNTASLNSQKQITGDGEITVQNSQNVRVFNNIMVAPIDRPANTTLGSTGVDFSHNIVFGGNRFTSTGGSNRLGVNPLLQGGSGVDAYRLMAASPAANSAAATAVAVPAQDLFGATRPRSGTADVGAVESL
jgi:hypothetical protein